MLKNMKILYVVDSQRDGLMSAIASAIGGERFYADRNTSPFQYLENVNGVVLVHRQQGIFYTEDIYFDFLRQAHTRGIRVAAVLERGDVLPRHNEGLDRVIETTKGERTIKSIADELSGFFRIRE